MKRYLALTAFSFLACLVAVAGFTRLVDPYGYWGGPEIAGVNVYKPAAGRHLAAVKLRQVARVRPATIVAGNSRVGAGFDPQSAAWPEAARPVYNLGLPGVGTAELVDILLQAIERDPPRHVVFAVDFVDFPLSREAWRSWTAAAAPRPAPSTLRERIEILLSLDALEDSAAALVEQHKANPTHTTPAGFDTLAFYNDSVAAEGHAALFEQRQRENVARYLASPKAVRWPGPGGSPHWAALDRLADACRRRGIALTLVTYPYHADILLAFEQTGLWPAFEDWHRGLADFSARTGTPVWDFSRVSEETAEPVPAPGDTRTRMRWYWEAGHFKATLGARIAADLTGPRPALGAPLALAGLDPALAAKRRAVADYALRRTARSQPFETASARLPFAAARTR